METFLYFYLSIKSIIVFQQMYNMWWFLVILGSY
jgi:hypothetical protein